MELGVEIDEWKVDKVKTMEGMFRSSSFDQPLIGWTTKNCQNMKEMFKKNVRFNQKLDSFDVSHLKKEQMENMFLLCTEFLKGEGRWKLFSKNPVREKFKNGIPQS